MIHPWHDVKFGEKAPEIVKSIIEIPKGSRAKYELDKETGLLKLDRVLFSSVNYPANYGFIPRTLGDDHDPLDILVISQINVEPLCIVDAKVIGAMRMMDNNEADDKIIAVAAYDVSMNHINDIHELPQYFVRELERFFEDYKKLEHKSVKVKQFQDKTVGMQIINQSIQLYQEKYGRSRK